MRFVESLASRMGIMGELLMFFLGAQVVVAYAHDFGAAAFRRSDHLRSKLSHSTLYLCIILVRHHSCDQMVGSLSSGLNLTEALADPVCKERKDMRTKEGKLS